MFSTVWPLTALCAMINNWVELRADAIKVCTYTRYVKKKENVFPM